MYLYMKQKVFSWKDRFTITDSDGNDRYSVEGKVISIGKKLHIFDAQGDEVAFVRQKITVLMPRFIVEIGGEEVARIVKKISFLKPKYVVEGLGWEVQGDMFAHDYTIVDGDRTIVSIHKKWMAWGDTFELDIENDRDEVLALAVVLAIDAVMDSQTTTVNASN
ncbi:MAG: LURP-one-related family protein [Clostridia bacterium]|nr:LURP-one-related family protein [Clostridia bacterium]